MIKNYLLICINILMFSICLLYPAVAFPQEPKIFTRSDFDLSGPVKTCRVITDYGKEDFEFNSDGLLTKSVTRYNENNYDISYYKYKSDQLIERRDERYQDGVFDENTSMAHFYSYDTVPSTVISEKILSYNKEFQEQYDYHYDINGQLFKIIRSHAEGVDETQIEYSEFKGETTVSYILNGLLQKTIRTSYLKMDDDSEVRVVLTKYFLEGVPERAVEQIINSNDQLISELEFTYQPSEKSFVPQAKKEYVYDSQDQLESVTSTLGKFKDIKEYLYQFDNSEGGNWVKKIITPENSYTTRIIEYYDLIRKENN